MDTGGKETSSASERPHAQRWATALGAAAAWAMVVPFAGRAVGIELDVPARVEIADHVLPGLVVLAAGAALVAGARAGRRVAPGDAVWSIGAATAFLAGFWITSTHAPLVAEAIDGITRWDAAVLHATSGVPMLMVGGWMLLEPFLVAGRRR